MKQSLKIAAILLTVLPLAVILLSACDLSIHDYYNYTDGYYLQYPKDVSTPYYVVLTYPNYIKIILPIPQISGTYLESRYYSYVKIEVEDWSEDGGVCSGGYPSVPMPDAISLQTYSLYTGSAYGVRDFIAFQHDYDDYMRTITYSTARPGACIHLSFLLYALLPSTYPLSYNGEIWNTQNTLFLEMVKTFRWLTPTPTPEGLPIQPFLTVKPFDFHTSTPTSGILQFVPDFNAYCRSGPDMSFGPISLAMEGVSYPVDGRNAENTWLRIMLQPSIGCWVPIEDGNPSGDTISVRVLAKIPTPTLPSRRLACSQFTSPQTCSQHAECSWNRLVTPAVCENK